MQEADWQATWDENNYGNRTDGKPNPWFAVPGLEKYWGTDTFVSEALTLEAIKALDHAKEYNQPFFLYMAHYAIHVPIDKRPNASIKNISIKVDSQRSCLCGPDRRYGQKSG